MTDTDTSVDPLARLIAWHAVAAEVPESSRSSAAEDDLQVGDTGFESYSLQVGDTGHR